jgi:hypothetical protein
VVTGVEDLYYLQFWCKLQLVSCTNLHNLWQSFTLQGTSLVLPHWRVLDTVWKIVCCISNHFPPCTWSPITSCSKHVSKERWIPISIKEMEILNLHKSHSSSMRTCKTGGLYELSSIGHQNWMRWVHPNLKLCHLWWSDI